MHFSSFTISNYKGIKSTTIDLHRPGASSIMTLIGLNESGKTTILEAISQFVSGDKSIKALYAEDEQITGIESENGVNLASFDNFIPKDKKSNFTDKIEICAIVQFDDQDIENIHDILQREEEAISIYKDSFPRRVRIVRRISYKDSDYDAKSSGTYWNLSFEAKTASQRKYRRITPSTARPVWLKALRAIEDNLPDICYFPTFLFDFPRKIYLVEHEEESPRNKIYRRALQDILDSEGSGLNVEQHIVQRLRSVGTTEESWEVLFSIFWRKEAKEKVDHVLTKMEEHTRKTIFDAWEMISRKRIDSKRISIELGVDDENQNLPYLSFSIQDGTSKYAIQERSLGFKWFFSFLLFTQFRARRQKDSPTLFLFDEPASNLHATAQARLLESFPRIATDNTSIIFSTHSLYLIEPRWLERAYIVENSAVDMQDTDEYLTPTMRETNVSAIPYKRFVGENPDRGSYFQPVLDRLQSMAPAVTLPNDVFILEGKTDFYFFKYFEHKYGTSALSAFPSAGANGFDTLISLALGFGRSFVILADDDKAGKAAVARYRKNYLLENQAYTYGDLSPSFSKHTLESFFSEQVIGDMKAHFEVTSLKKKHIGYFFQEKSITLDYDLDEETKLKVMALLEEVRSKMDNQEP